MSALKLPPHATETEQELIGCLLAGVQEVLADCLAEIRLEWFYNLRHQAIAEAVIALQCVGSPIEVSTVRQKLKDTGQLDGVGGTAYLLECQEAAVSAHAWVFHAAILRDKFILRQIGQVCGKLASQSHDETDVEGLLDSAEKQVLAIRGGDGSTEGTMMEHVHAVISKKEDDAAGKPLRGLSTGFRTLDAWTRGLSPTQLIIIAARPSVGKTSMAMQIADRIATEDRQPVGVFSLESSAVEIVEGMLNRRARLESHRMTEQQMRSFNTESARVGKSPLHICDDGGLTIGQLSAKARRWKQRHGIVLLVVDYIQLVSGSGKKDNRANEVGEVSRGLKRLAMELKIPVIALAQVNRDCEKNDRAPRLSDLRESGGIEADANIVILLHTKTEDAQMREVLVNVAKNRGGRRGVIEMMFNAPLTEFREADRISESDMQRTIKPNHNDY